MDVFTWSGGQDVQLRANEVLLRSSGLRARVLQETQSGFRQNGGADGEAAFVYVEARIMDQPFIVLDPAAQGKHGAGSDLGKAAEILSAQPSKGRLHVLAPQ